MSRIDELFEEMDPEYWADYEGLEYTTGRGVSGMQLNLKECPFCGDRRWRSYMGAETGIGNCFVCDQTWVLPKIVRQVVGLRGAALEKYLSEVLRAQGWRPKKKATAAVEHGAVELPLSFPLPTNDGQNLVYLEKRGVTKELAAYFHLRFCIDGWWRFTREDGKLGGQNFKGRVIIPVFDLDGKLVTFQGRDITGTSDRKYLFPSSLPGTGRYLYNGQNANKASRAVLGEGAMDVIALKAALDEDVTLRDVAPMGTFGKHLSYGDDSGNDQLGRLIMLRRGGLREVTIMWDGEEKALVAALDACKVIRGVGLTARVAMLPKGKDPNEATPQEVRKAFHGARLYTPALDVRMRLKNPYAR